MASLRLAYASPTRWLTSFIERRFDGTGAVGLTMVSVVPREPEKALIDEKVSHEPVWSHSVFGHL